MSNRFKERALKNWQTITTFDLSSFSRQRESLPSSRYTCVYFLISPSKFFHVEHLPQVPVARGWFCLTTYNKRERKSYTLQLAIKQIRSIVSHIVEEQARPVLALWATDERFTDRNRGPFDWSHQVRARCVVPSWSLPVNLDAWKLTGCKGRRNSAFIRHSMAAMSKWCLFCGGLKVLPPKQLGHQWVTALMERRSRCLWWIWSSVFCQLWTESVACRKQVSQGPGTPAQVEGEPREKVKRLGTLWRP